MRSILIIHRKQFGYHTDSFELAKHLSADFKVSFICMDAGYNHFVVPNVNVQYVSSTGSYAKRTSRFIKACVSVSKMEFDYRFMTYFRFCSLVKMFSQKKFVLDFRTGSVHKVALRRFLDDMLRRISVLMFERITVISEGLRRKLSIPKSKSYILPLGSNVLSSKPKVFKEPRLLYVGTFNNRRIEQTINGVAAFIDKNPKYAQSLTYDIVGSGTQHEERAVFAAIEENDLKNNVLLHGRQSHAQVQHLFDDCNIGVSYIPLTSYFDHQSPTKTFEYILAGQVCLATSTSENRKYVTEVNGILHKDNADDFAKGLSSLVEKFADYNSETIRQSLKEYTWTNIVESFKDYLLAC